MRCRWLARYGKVLLLILAAYAAIFIRPGLLEAQNIKVTVGQTGRNPGTSLYVIAQKENLFTKHGLDVNIIQTSTANAVQAMLSGTMQMTTGSGAAAFVTATLEGAPPFVLVSSWMNVFPYALMARKEIRKAEDLKGKIGHIGAPFGTIPDTALRFALAKLGIDPERDVKLIQLPRPDVPTIVAQIESGDAHFGPLPPPYDRIAEKRGAHRLFSLPELGIPWQQNGEWMLHSYLQKNRGTVLRFVRAIADAMAVYYDQKEKTINYLMEYLGSNREDTLYAYEAFKKWGDRVPTPKVEGIKTTFDAIKRKTPKAAGADPAPFIDTSLVSQLVKEGYFK